MSYHARVTVRRPYRLDLTVDALRRVRANLVDVVTSDGRYMRALAANETRVNVVEVQQLDARTLDVRISGQRARQHLETVSRMLGVEVDLHSWYRSAKLIPWIDALAKEFRGLKPPRYPELWEALCHGIVFQQLSIQAGAAAMARFVERFSKPVAHGGVSLYPFPFSHAILDATLRQVQSVGLSRMKASYIRNAAQIIVAGNLSARHIERLSTNDAEAALCELRGIGPWSAALVLLRGLGRLDVFPLGDAGAVRGLERYSVSGPAQITKLLSRLGDTRGMLYFHLLLARRMTETLDSTSPAETRSPLQELSVN